jgi:cobaltochelatase CobS
MNIKLELSKLQTPVLNTVLTNRGLQFYIVKGDAVNAVAELINNGYVTFDEVRNTVPSQASTLATNSKIDDEVKRKIMQSQADISSAIENVHRVQDTAKALLDEQRNQRTANDAKFSEMTGRLNNALTSIQGVDYGKVETVIRTQVSDLFESFRKVTPREEVVAIANAIPKTTRKTAFELFGDVCKYDDGGQVIDFGGMKIEVWADPDAPALVDDYIFNPENLHQTLIALDDKLPHNSWLAGERGTGKSEFVSQIASRLGRRLYRVNFDEAIERSEFIGGNTIKGGDVEWKEGVITQAIQHAGAIVLLDEIGFARSQNLAVLHALCERTPNRSIVIAETGVRIPVASHVAFFCADNSNGHGDESGNFDGVRGKNSAFIDRFSFTMVFNYLPHDKEVALISKRTMLPVDATDVIVKFANTAREKARAGLLTQPPSLRQLFAWASAIQKGLPIGIAFNNAIVNKYPAECESELRGIYSATIDVDALKSFLVK